MAILCDITWVDKGMLAATVAVGVVTLFVATVSYRLFKLQTDPHVIVYAKHDISRPTCILIVIENIGRGLAKDVHFELSRPIPRRASSPPPNDLVMSDGPLITGVPAIGPGDSRVIYWADSYELLGRLGDELIYVTCIFKNEKAELMKPVDCLLEVGSLRSTDAVDPDGARQSAKQLKRIADDLKSALRGDGALKTEISKPSGMATEKP